jgi:hypothetical protein
MMPLKGMFQWWRTLGAPEKGVAVSLGFPLDWTADTQTMGGERWGLILVILALREDE